MTTTDPAPTPRVERVLATVAICVAVAAFGCLLAVVLAPLFGVPGADMVSPGWQTAFLTAYLGLPIAILLVLTMVVTRLVQNRRRAPRS